MARPPLGGLASLSHAAASGQPRPSASPVADGRGPPREWGSAEDAASTPPERPSVEGPQAPESRPPQGTAGPVMCRPSSSYGQTLGTQPFMPLICCIIAGAGLPSPG